MSNIGNQVVAVVATLLGFIAHDYLTEARPVANSSANVIVAADINPTVTRSVDMQDLSLEAATSLPVAPAAMPAAPAAAMTGRTAAVKAEDLATALADLSEAHETKAFRSIAPQEAGYIR